MTDYDADYYEHGPQTGKSLYENYRWLPKQTTAMVQAINQACGITKDDTILDFGCAKGYCVKAWRKLGFIAYGVDISAYAISKAPKDIAEYVWCLDDPADVPHPFCEAYDWIIAKDVLEHVELYDLTDLLGRLSVLGRNAFVVVPLGNEGHWTIPKMAQDSTHKIANLLWWWEAELSRWWPDVAAFYTLPGIKDRWKEYPTGHGLFICKQKDGQ